MARKKKVTTRRYVGPPYQTALHYDGVDHDPRKWTAEKIEQMIEQDARWQLYFTTEGESSSTEGTTEPPAT
jgi:hypothetical protein